MLHREKHGDFFGIAVAGYPEAHPDVITDDPEKMKEAYWNDIRYLKQKVPPTPCIGPPPERRMPSLR